MDIKDLKDAKVTTELLGVMGSGRVRLERKEGVEYVIFLYTYQKKKLAFWIKYADLDKYLTNFKQIIKAKGYGTSNN